MTKSFEDLLSRVNACSTKKLAVAVAQDKGLIVTALEDDQNLQEKVLSVFHAAVVTFEVTNCVKIIENQHGVGTYITVKR